MPPSVPFSPFPLTVVCTSTVPGCLERGGVEGVGGVVEHAAGAAHSLGGVVAGAGSAVLL